MVYRNWRCLMRCGTARPAGSVQNDSRTWGVTYSLVQPSLTHELRGVTITAHPLAVYERPWLGDVLSRRTWFVHMIYLFSLLQTNWILLFSLTTPPSLFNATKPLLWWLCNKPSFPLWHCTSPSWHADAIWQLPSPLHRQCVWDGVFSLIFNSTVNIIFVLNLSE